MKRWVSLVFVALISVRALPSHQGGELSREQLFDLKTKKGIDLVYNLEFERAEAEFHELLKMDPEHPAGHFFLAMVDWWRIVVNMDDETHDDRFIEALDEVIELCDERLKQNRNDVTALFFKGGAIGFQGRLHAHRSRWLAAANAGRKALPIVQQASSLDPENRDILLGTGIYNYYAEVIPQEFPWVKPLMIFVPAGDKQKGIEELTTASQKGKYAAIEATYFLMQLYYQYERNYTKTLQLALSLHARFPNNMLFHKYVGRCHVSLGNWPLVEQVFNEVVQRVKDKRTGYDLKTAREAEYYLGLAKLNTGRQEESLEHFLRCDTFSRRIDAEEPSGFMVMANLKAGNVYDMQGKRELAVERYQRVLKMKAFKDSHAQAERHLKEPYRN